LDEHFGSPPESVWEYAVEQIVHPLFLFNSLIISNFPEIFSEFRWKLFSLLWRGSRDGFKGQEFHRRCDGHANTLSVILDTEGNIFGGFTPVEWNSVNKHKADDSLKSFLFTLKDPHSIPARRFTLKSEEKHQAISYHSQWVPCDIAVSDKRNANDLSATKPGSADINDTGLEGDVIFTGS
jgi:hypothetical protein